MTIHPNFANLSRTWGANTYIYIRYIYVYILKAIHAKVFSKNFGWNLHMDLVTLINLIWKLEGISCFIHLMDISPFVTHLGWGDMCWATQSEKRLTTFPGAHEKRCKPAGNLKMDPPVGCLLIKIHWKSRLFFVFSKLQVRDYWFYCGPKVAESNFTINGSWFGEGLPK